ncbi:MAG: amidohydrolase family protein [Treponema sp.]|nr:amidohydrolase family protein [Treponema sp.]
MDRIVELSLAHDHHSHVSLYAAMDGVPDISSLDAAQATALLAALPGDSLSLVKGWRSDRLDLGPAVLEKLPPVLIVNSSLHGFALSPSARPFAERLWPELAGHGDDRQWGELHLPDLFVFYTRLAGLDSEKLARFMAGMAALGIHSLEDMTISGAEALRAFAEAGLGDRVRSWATPKVFASLSRNDRARCEGVKIFLDGSLGARSAALDEGFLDGSQAALLYGDEELLALLAALAAERTGLSVHAIGHRAIEQILGALRTLRREGLEFETVRLEHVQFISQEQGRAARDLGLVLSMQPNFSMDSELYADRLRERHRVENNPFRMLIDRLGFRPGLDLVFGSDGMPHGIPEALRWSLFPPHEGQVLGLDEFVAGSKAPNDSTQPVVSLRYRIDSRSRSVEALES